MGLLDDFRGLSEQVRRRADGIRGRGEEAAKQALILPFLSAMGWDIYDPNEVQPEYVADFAQKKGGVREKVDYALLLNGKPAIFVEAKSLDAKLDLHDAQLARYFNATPTVKTAILTNGLTYRFFTDLQEPNIMSEAPFFEFNILEFKESDITTLRRFTKASYDPAEVRASAEDLVYVSQITGFVTELIRNPSESFIRFILTELKIVESRRINTRVLERFWTVVHASFQSAFMDMATRSIRQETQPDPGVASLGRPAAHPPQAAPTTPNEAKVVTTAEELAALALVQSICASSPQATQFPTQSKDLQSYLTVFVRTPSNFVVRMVFDAKRKNILTQLPIDKAKTLAPEFEVEAAPSGNGVSRIYLPNGGADLAKLNNLILAAYEDQVRDLAKS